MNRIKDNAEQDTKGKAKAYEQQIGKVGKPSIQVVGPKVAVNESKGHKVEKYEPQGTHSMHNEKL